MIFISSDSQALLLIWEGMDGDGESINLDGQRASE